MDRVFDRFGPLEPETPVIVSVPHAGRIYPAAMANLARQSHDQLRVLEDRFVDRLASGAAAAGHQVIIAQIARGWIDLNRDEREIDADMVAGNVGKTIHSAKVRGGLGLIPRRTAAGGDIWRGRLTIADVAARINQCFTPYHTQLESMMAAAHDRFGIAVLFDLHSMPPPANRRDAAVAHLVVGDLHGRSTGQRFTSRLIDEARTAGFRTALNVPYAGGYTLARHGQPAAGRHAVQLEVGRQLYLDQSLDQCGAGAQAIGRLVTRLVNALADESLAGQVPLAAE